MQRVSKPRLICQDPAEFMASIIRDANPGLGRKWKDGDVIYSVLKVSDDQERYGIFTYRGTDKPAWNLLGRTYPNAKTAQKELDEMAGRRKMEVLI